MHETLTLSQLGFTYLAEAKLIDDKINKYNSLLKDALKKFDPDEILRYRRLLRLYYEQRTELRYNGRLLVNYYEKD